PPEIRVHVDGAVHDPIPRPITIVAGGPAAVSVALSCPPESATVNGWVTRPPTSTAPVNVWTVATADDPGEPGATGPLPPPLSHPAAVRTSIATTSRFRIRAFPLTDRLTFGVDRPDPPDRPDLRHHQTNLPESHRRELVPQLVFLRLEITSRGIGCRN